MVVGAFVGHAYGIGSNAIGVVRTVWTDSEIARAGLVKLVLDGFRGVAIDQSGCTVEGVKPDVGVAQRGAINSQRIDSAGLCGEFKPIIIPGRLDISVDGLPIHDRARVCCIIAVVVGAFVGHAYGIGSNTVGVVRAVWTYAEIVRARLVKLVFDGFRGVAIDESRCTVGGVEPDVGVAQRGTIHGQRIDSAGLCGEFEPIIIAGRLDVSIDDLPIRDQGRVRGIIAMVVGAFVGQHH